MKRKVHIFGKLAEIVGSDVVEVDAPTLQQLLGYFKQYDKKFDKTIQEFDWVFAYGKDVDHLYFVTDANGLLLNLGDNDVWIAPCVEGEGPVFGFVGALFGGTLFGGGILGGIVGHLATALLFTGIAYALSPHARGGSTGEYAPQAENPSYLFNGAVNVSEQGGPVPIVYGRTRCSSVVISSAVETEALPT